jgi:hypothetical protein
MDPKVDWKSGSSETPSIGRVDLTKNSQKKEWH